jgi:hypothetical protein
VNHIHLGCDSPLFFQFSPVLVSSLQKEVVRTKIHVLPVTLHAGTVQPSHPVKLLLDLVELAVVLKHGYCLSLGLTCNGCFVVAMMLRRGYRFLLINCQSTKLLNKLDGACPLLFR